jgi:AcrR family transcriptional regulator
MMRVMSSHPDLAPPRRHDSGAEARSGPELGPEPQVRATTRDGHGGVTRPSKEVPAKPNNRRTGAAERRHARQREIVEATRALFDAREMRDANIDDIARAVGVNRAIIYRHFASKDELFALTLAEYLTELRSLLQGADAGGTPPERLADIAGAYADFCLKYPAFLDCALALLRQPASDLISEVSEAVIRELGRQLGACLATITRVLRDGTATGDFAVEDVDLTANMIYLQTLGSLHLARTGFIVGEGGHGSVSVRAVDEDQFRSLVVRAVLSAARV